jgi:hypothetical protein
MTFPKRVHRIPRSVIVQSDTPRLLVAGQGVFLFRQTDLKTPCIFYLYTTDAADGFRVKWTTSAVNVTRISTEELLEDPNNKTGLTLHQGAYYWFSLDAQHQTLRAGVGEARLETQIFEYEFPWTTDDERKANKKFFESIQSIQISDEATALFPLRLIRDPVTTAIPAIVKGMAELSMEDISHSTYLPDGMLSSSAQQLYHCIAGKTFTLDTEDFPEFSQAIENSIRNPWGWCYKRLQEKSREFNKDKPNLEETYLRITLGQNSGESPGIPYVMEIWPVGHYSPVHNHSAAHAIIRVLHGEIQVSQFPYLCADGVPPFAVTPFHKDQITWISPTLNQTHQLLNRPENATACVTIQCYLYDDKDTSHYDYFDYVDANGAIQQYEPDSDMDFHDFKERMKLEWENRSPPPQAFSTVPNPQPLEASRWLCCFGGSERTDPPRSED